MEHYFFLPSEILMKVKTNLGSSGKLFYKNVDVPSRVAEPRDAVAKALATSVQIYVPATIVKIGRWVMAMIKRKKMTKFNLRQKMKMMMENLIIKKRMIPLPINYWDYLVMGMMI